MYSGRAAPDKPVGQAAPGGMARRMRLRSQPTIEAAGSAMDRDQLIQRLRARVRRGGPAEQVWWNGELVHVSEAILRAAELNDNEQIRARGDDVVIPRQLEDA